ncbi:MAG: hypothetical protein QF704_10450, partial [Anaerolineales bacterium]|nr:hypothetical protein [Anaerolineales bacterium]
STSGSLLSGSSKARSHLCNKLHDRVQSFNDHALFITLTYDRSNFESASHLYREQSEKRHVRLFIRRLSAYLGQSLNGKWVRKMEFQNGGWVHFHLIIDSPRRIPQKDLQSIWGFGHTWINSAKYEHIRYFCKYIAKQDSIPPYLYNERSRSIKLVACSPKFWNTENDVVSSIKRSCKWAVYTPVVNSLRSRTILKTNRGQRTLSIPIHEVLSFFISKDAVLLGKNHEYLNLLCFAKDIDYLNTFHDNTHFSRQGVAGSPARPSLLDNGHNSAQLECEPELSNDLVDPFDTWHIDFLADIGVFLEQKHAGL